MRTLTAGQQAAVNAGNGQPDCKLELIDWAPHYAAVFTGGPAGLHGACLAGDGSLVQGYSDGAGNVYARRVTDPTQASWGAWTLLSATAAHATPVCAAHLSDRVRVIWQDGASTWLYYRDSFDNGATWTAASALFDVGGACFGIGCDGAASPVFALYAFAANVIRVGVWTLSGSWSKADWTNGDSYAGSGLGVVANGGTYLVAVCLQALSTMGTALETASWSAGAWSALTSVVPADVGAGISAGEPKPALYDGLYQLAYAVVDSGSVSGLASSRAARLQSADGIHWSDPLPDGNSYAHGAAPIKHASGYLLAAPDVGALAPLYTGSAAQYRDCTADLISLNVRQVDGQAAQLVVTLENDAGQYVGLACLRPNARLRLSLGFAGLGTVYTHVCYVEDWTYERAGDLCSVVVLAGDGRGWLARQSRTTLTWTGQTVGWLAKEVLARAGLLSVAALPGTAQFGYTVGSFVIAAGQTWGEALARVGALYGFDVAVRALADGTDQAIVVEKNPADAAAWAYGDEVDGLALLRSGDRANHVLVYGAPAVGVQNLGEAWDFADVGSVGQERYLHVLEPEATSAAMCQTRATLELNVEKRRALGGQVVAGLHPGLELYDVVSLADGKIGVATARISSLSHQYDPQTAVYDIVAGLEAP